MTTSELETIRTLQLIESANQAAKIGIFQFDANTGEIYWNEVLRSIYEVTEYFEPSMDKVLNFVKETNCREKLKKAHREALEQGKPYELEYQIITAKGKERYIWVKGQTIFEEGQCMFSQGAVMDITERKQAEIELEKKHQQLRLTEQSIDLGYWRWDTLKNEETWSDNLYKIFEREKGGKLTIETYLEYVHDDDKAMVAERLEDAYKYKLIPEYSHRIVLKNGAIKTILLTGQVITDESGRVTEMVGTCQDISEKQAKENELYQKNQQLQFAEELTQVGYWQWNVETNEVLWSDNLYRIFEHDPSDPLTLESYLTYVHKEDRSAATANIENILKTKKFNDSVYRIKLNDGTIKTIKSVGNVITSKNGEITQMLGTCQDISEAKRKEQELLQKNRQLNKAEKVANIGSWTYDPFLDDFKWSDNLYRIYGFEIGLPIDFETFLTKVHPEDIELVKKQRDEIIHAQVFNKLIHRIVHKNGTVRIIEAIGTIIKNDLDEIVEVLGTSRDITEQRKAENKFLETYKSLEQTTIELTSRNKQLAEFNHITSHNLRAPVSNLNALLDLWKRANDKLKEELFDKFEIVIDHLSWTLDSLIESLKITTSQDVAKHELSFKETLNKTKEILAAEILKTGTKITSDFSAVESISYNQIYLESIFLNLIGNAIKYKSPERNPEIDISTTLVYGKIKLSIRDNGLGIDLKKHGSKLFGLNKVFHKHPEAKGVGLFMTKIQIEAMGGSIFAESEVNVGTTFFITFN